MEVLRKRVGLPASPKHDSGATSERWAAINASDPVATAAENYSVVPEDAKVDGREIIWSTPGVVGSVSNYSSIEASLGRDWEELDGIREVPFVAFTEMPDKLEFRSDEEETRTRELADEIKASGQIEPLIVVVDKRGPYVLEGAHRFDALRLLKAKSFPALVVLDTSSQKGAKHDSDGGGSRETGELGPPAPLSVPTRDRVHTVEAEIRARPTERLVAVDKTTGAVVFAADGTESYVQLDRSQMGILKANPGAVLTHNHPRGTSFSLDDTLLASNVNAGEMRATGRLGGQAATYRIAPAVPGKWPTRLDVTNQYVEADADIYAKRKADIRDGKLTVEEANQTHHHELWKSISEKLGLRYERRLG